MFRELLCVLKLYPFSVCFWPWAFLGAAAESQSGSLLPEPANTRKLKRPLQVVPQHGEKLPPSSWGAWRWWAGAAAPWGGRGCRCTFLSHRGLRLLTRRPTAALSFWPASIPRVLWPLPAGEARGGPAVSAGIGVVGCGVIFTCFYF